MAELTLPTRACPLEINMDADTTMTDASDLSVISRLLDLPGELRNNIYNVIVAGEEAQKLQLRYLRQGRSRAKSSLEVRHPSRQFLGFAQTNRLLRAEFWPLYTKVRRPAIDISELAEYLEVFPLPNAARTHSIITILRAVRRVRANTVAKAPVVDILPLLREDWTTYPFTIADEINYNDLTFSTLHLFLEQSYHKRGVYDDLLRAGTAAIYYSRRTIQKNSASDVITLRLSNVVNNKASNKTKLLIFQNFVNDTGILQSNTWTTLVECVSGRQKMVASNN